MRSATNLAQVDTNLPNHPSLPHSPSLITRQARDGLTLVQRWVNVTDVDPALNQRYAKVSRWMGTFFTTRYRSPHCRLSSFAKPKRSNCLFGNLAVTAFWLCTVVLVILQSG